MVVLSFPSLKIIYEHSAAFRLSVPYVPGFLAMREVPALAEMFRQVPKHMLPQVVLVDGNGAFHPRKCGAATHLGISIDLPTIGVAKDVQQVGDVNSSVARRLAKTLQKGEWGPLCSVAALLRNSQIGTRSLGCLVVSPGHRVSLQTAISLTSKLCQRSVPEPIRQADLCSRRAVRAWYAGTELDYMVAPRLSHLEHMLQITSNRSRTRSRSPAEGRQNPRDKKGARWVVKEQPTLKPNLKTDEPCNIDGSSVSYVAFEHGGWTQVLFGWICVCFTRPSSIS